MYVFQLFDYYGASGMCLLWMCLFEAIVMGWIYGAAKFEADIELMLRQSILPYFRFAWKYMTPLVSLGILMSTLITHTPIKYNRTYEYPGWAIAFGWLLALSSMLALPLYALYAFVTTPGSMRQRWIKLTTPSISPVVLAEQRKNKNDFA
jgi:solute carrier family 6 GABA transporter-like protein 6/8/11/12/13